MPYEALTARHYLYDLVYNPEETQFLKNGAAAGAKTCNGLGMLYRQDLFEQAGLEMPERPSWAELQEFAAALHDLALEGRIDTTDLDELPSSVIAQPPFALQIWRSTQDLRMIANRGSQRLPGQRPVDRRDGGSRGPRDPAPVPVGAGRRPR